MPAQTKEKQITEYTLPELMAAITKRILTVLESTDTASKQAEINGCRNDFRLWFEGQPTDKRKELAKDYRRIIMNYKNIGEQLYFDIVSLTAGDV